MNEPDGHSEYESFSPRQYLDEYYLSIGSENDFLLKAIAESMQPFPDDSLSILEVGGGPTVYQIISSARVAKEIHFTDYSQNNLDEVDKWLRNEPGSFDWDQFVARGLELEGLPSDEESLAARKELIRRKVTKTSRYDVINDDLLETGQDKYDLVSSVFSTDAITHSVPEWKEVLKNLYGRINDDGWLLLVGVLGSDSWVMGSETFKATNLDEQTVKDTLIELGLRIDMYESVPAEDGNEHGYDGVFVVKAQRN